eukprot:435027-Pelagomonas_calceolata.AAC.1
MDIGSGDRLAQQNLQMHMHQRELYPLTFFQENFLRSRLTSSRPDAILITPYKAGPTPSSPSSTGSHHALRSRHNPTLRTTTANR